MEENQVDNPGGPVMCMECKARPVCRFKKQLCKACYNKPYMKKYRSSDKGKEINRISQKRWRGAHHPLARLTNGPDYELIRTGRYLLTDAADISNYLVDGNLPPTSQWTSAQTAFFKVGFLQVKKEEWHLLTDPATMTFEAEMLSTSDMGMEQFVGNKHSAKGVPYALSEFGDLLLGIMNNPENPKAATDLLAIFLLRVCNKARSLVLPLLQKNEWKVQVGDLTFASVPDGGAFLRKIGSKPSVALLLVEDTIPADATLLQDKEFQIAGEMIAAAACNYHDHNLKFAQSTFVVRLAGPYISFYRLDVPATYLQALTKGERPVDLTVLRFSNDNNMALNLATPGPERKIALEVLCSIMNTCGVVAASLQESQPSEITRGRIEVMYPTLNEVCNIPTASLAEAGRGMPIPAGAMDAGRMPDDSVNDTLPLLILAESSSSTTALSNFTRRAPMPVPVPVPAPVPYNTRVPTISPGFFPTQYTVQAPVGVSGTPLPGGSSSINTLISTPMVGLASTPLPSTTILSAPLVQTEERRS